MTGTKACMAVHEHVRVHEHRCVYICCCLRQFVGYQPEGGVWVLR